MNEKENSEGARAKNPWEWAQFVVFRPIVGWLAGRPRWLQIIIAGLVIISVVLLSSPRSRTPLVSGLGSAITAMGERLSSLGLDRRFQNEDPFQIAVFYLTDQGNPVLLDGFRDGLAEFRLREAAESIPIFESFSLTDVAGIVLGERLLARMQKLYASEDRVRVFIVATSTAIEQVRPHFIVWRRALAEQGLEAPVLIATVASSPGLADRDHGIYRYYPRSQEESTLLAELAWARGFRTTAVFYVTRTADKDDDSYGVGARDRYIDRFEALGGTCHSWSVLANGTDAEEAVRAMFSQHPDEDSLAVFVAGYGTMLRKTIDELLVGGFGGLISCTLSLTNPESQPSSRAHDEKIVTLTPVRLNMPRPPPAEKRAARLFPKLLIVKTLDARLRCRTFSDFDSVFWGNSSADATISISFTEDGDSIVELKSNDAWR